MSDTVRIPAMHKRTDELVPGDRVRIPFIRVGSKVRTVASVEPSGYVNHRNEPILTVRYVEPAEQGVWSNGNTGAPGSMWDLATADSGRATLTSAIALAVIATIGAIFASSLASQAAAMLGGVG